MDSEAGLEIHVQGSLVVLFSPGSLPSSLDRIGGGITLRNLQLVSTELVASGVQKRGAYSFPSVSRGYEEAHDRANGLSGIVYDCSIPPHVEEARPRHCVAPANHPPIGDG